MSRRNLLAAALIAPLLLLVTLSFLVPLGATLYRAVDDSEFSTTLPRTTALLRAWDGKDLPPDEAFAAMTQRLGDNAQHRRYLHWFFFGAGFSLWASWQLSTLAGVLAQARS